MELGSNKARKVFQELSKNIKNIFYIENLGRENYLSMMKYSDLVIGNSSMESAKPHLLGLQV